MRISAIIPVFNCERYVGEAVESAMRQNRKLDEIIVVNDGSTDGTANVLASFGERIQVVTQLNSGTPTALNAGLSVATGDVLTFLDADDLWSVEKTKLQCEILAEKPSIEAVFGMVRQFVSEDIIRNIGSPRPARAPQSGVSKITMMIRRTSFERVGGFNEAIRFAEFVEWYTRATAASLSMFVLDRVVALRRIHGANQGILKRKEQVRQTLHSLKQMLPRHQS